MKIVIRLLTAGLIVSGLTVAGSTEAAGRWLCRGPWIQWGLIAAGVRLGEFHLGSAGMESLQKLAKPDAVESGKSGTCLVWKWGEEERFFVHSVTNTSVGGDGDAAQNTTVDLIGFSYPRYGSYKTTSDISTGSTLEQIRKSFPDARPVATAPTVYDDVQKGIAFEFANEPDADSACVAIMVHLPGQSPAMTLEDVNELLKKGSGR